MYVAIALSESEFGEAQNQSFKDGQKPKLIFNLAICVIVSKCNSDIRKFMF